MPAKAAPKKNLSALKRARQAEKTNEHNRMRRTKIKSVIKAVEAAVKNKNKDASENALKLAVTTISRSVSKGIIHKNNASRKISRLTKKVNTVPKAAEV